MAELTEKCKTCKKAFHIWRYGIYGECLDKECNYDQNETIEEIQVKTETAEGFNGL